jgi:hypothetical protein
VGTIVGSVFRCLNLLCCVTLVCVWFASCFAVHGFGYRLDRLHARAMACTGFELPRDGRRKGRLYLVRLGITVRLVR